MAEFTWSAQAGRFREVASGRFVSEATVRAGVDALAALSAARMGSLAQRYRAGELMATAWLSAHLAEVKALHVAATLASYGGREQMTPARWGLVGQQIRLQYSYARQMVADVLEGRQRLNGRLDIRAASYANGGRLTFEAIRRRERGARGVRYERNLLHAAESCSGCLAETARGWVPYGALVPVGRRVPCGVYCKCTVEYRSEREAAAS